MAYTYCLWLVFVNDVDVRCIDSFANAFVIILEVCKASSRCIQVRLDIIFCYSSEIYSYSEDWSVLIISGTSLYSKEHPFHLKIILLSKAKWILICARDIKNIRQILSKQTKYIEEESSHSILIKDFKIYKVDYKTLMSQWRIIEVFKLLKVILYSYMIDEAGHAALAFASLPCSLTS